MLDAGASLIGDNNPAKQSQGESSVEAMNLLGYDAMTLSADDLVLGLEVLQKRQAEAEFPFLSANVVVSETDEMLATPYITREVSGLRVAVIGLTDVPTGDVRDVYVTDPVSATMQLMSEVKQSADFVIVLSHAGRPTDQRIAAQVPGVDWIVGGGPYAITPQPIVDAQTGVAIVQADHATPGHAGRAIGIGHLKFGADRRLSSQEWQSLYLGPEVASDLALSDFLTRWK